MLRKEKNEPIYNECNDLLKCQFSKWNFCNWVDFIYDGCDDY